MGDLLLASSSQDKYIRLWRISPWLAAEEKTTSSEEGPLSSLDGLASEMLSALQDTLSDLDAGAHLSTKAHTIAVEGSEKRFTLFLEAVLLGHDDWVYSVRWKPAQRIVKLDANGNESVRLEQHMRLVSASSDKSMMIWQPDVSTGQWINVLQVGDIGGHAYGVYGAVWSPSGAAIVGHGCHGMFHVWKQQQKAEQQRETEESSFTVERWVPEIGISGHFAPVRQLTWDPSNSFLVSVSSDQTTRLFAPWNRESSTATATSSETATTTTTTTTTSTTTSSTTTSATTSTPETTTWHEITRPQIHGYDLQCITFTGPLRFASGADGEKVIRVFDAPKSVVDILESITRRSVASAEQKARLPVGASLPALGLSNKTVERTGKDDSLGTGDDASVSTAFQSPCDDSRTSTTMFDVASNEVSQNAAFAQRRCSPPFEQHLIQYSLWPEFEKLYGHGYEIFALASSHDAQVMASASACKAAGQSEDAAIRMWDIRDVAPSKEQQHHHQGTWREYQAPLESHSLTITCLRFSWNDRYLLSASRDRMWTLFERVEPTATTATPATMTSEPPKYQVKMRCPKAHARIIWDAAWSRDDSFFVTVSRDKTLKIWKDVNVTAGGDWTCVRTLKADESVTAVAMVPVPLAYDDDGSNVSGKHIMAYGMETGEIRLLESTDAGGTWTTFGIDVDGRESPIQRGRCPAATVTSMQWRVVLGTEGTPISAAAVTLLRTQPYRSRIHIESESDACCHLRLELAVASEDHSVRILRIQ